MLSSRMALDVVSRALRAHGSRDPPAGRDDYARLFAIGGHNAKWAMRRAARSRDQAASGLLSVVDAERWSSISM